MNDKKYGMVYVTTSDGRTWNFENARIFFFANKLYVEEKNGKSIFKEDYLIKVSMYGETE